MTKDRSASLVEPVMIELKLSWVDRALRVVERLPAHPIAVYSVLALLGALVLQGIFWGCGVMPWGAVSVQMLTTGCWSILSLAGIHLSFAVAARSLNTFRPLLPGAEQGFARAY